MSYKHAYGGLSMCFVERMKYSKKQREVRTMHDEQLGGAYEIQWKNMYDTMNCILQLHGSCDLLYAAARRTFRRSYEMQRNTHDAR